jgi:hypothetical protein
MCEEREKHPLYKLIHPDYENRDNGVDTLWWKGCERENLKVSEVSKREVCNRVIENVEFNKVKIEEAEKVANCNLKRPSFIVRYLSWFLGLIFFLLGLFMILYLLRFIRNRKI